MPRYNKSPNPACAVDTTGWSAVGTGVTAARVANLTGFDRTTGFQATNGSGGGNLAVVGALHQTGSAGALAGQTWTVTMAFRCTAAATVNFYLAWRDSSGAAISNSGTTAITLSPGVPAIGVAGGVGPANAAGLTGVVIGASSSFPAAAALVGTCLRIERVDDPNLRHGDGASPRWAWDGAAGASTSTRASDDGAEWWAMGAVLL